MDQYISTDTIPLSFSRVRNNTLVTGLTVTVSIVNAKTGASLLGSTSMVEVNGVYTYSWTHGLTQDTECLVTYTVGSSKYQEFIFITTDPGGAHLG